MKFSNNRIFCYLFWLFWGGGNLAAQNLTVCSVEFPDTVTIGETVILTGYVLNKDNIVFTENIIVNIDIEDVTPDGILNDGEINESLTINQSNLAPNDSVYFERELLVNPQEFGVAGVDLVVVWPQVSANDGFIDNEADIQLTYVQDETGIDPEIANKSVEYDYLPESINEYITTHYPNASINDICMEQSNFKIKLDNEVLLIFSVDGKLQDMSDDNRSNTYDDDDESSDYDEDDDGDDYGDDDKYDEDEDGTDDDDRYDDDDDSIDDDNDDDGTDDDGKYDDDDSTDNGDDKYDDDDDSTDDDDDGTDDDDDYNNDDDDDIWNREMKTSPFKIIVNKQAIQVFSDDNYKITAVELSDLNGVIYQRLTNQHMDKAISLSIQNIGSYLGIVRVFMIDKENKPIEFYHKTAFGF